MARTKKDTTEEKVKKTKKTDAAKTVKTAKPAKSTKEKTVKKTTTPVEKKADLAKETATEATTTQQVEPVQTEQVQKATTSSSKSKKNLITGTGKRKTAVARVFLYETKGEFTVNGVDINQYFPTEQAQAKWMKPFHAIGVAHPTSKYSATIKVQGSGPAAQLSAVVHGFSRALSTMSDEFSEVLRKNDLLTRDPRMVERKKYWLKKARKAPQYSKR